MSDTFELGGDLRVKRLGFGAMRITGAGVWGWPPDRAAAKALLNRVVELGIDFIDTANAYGPETSEYLLAEALHPYRDVVIATKGGLERLGPQNWRPNGDPSHLRLACHNSLRRLEVDRIDVYQLHCIDDRVPLEDSLGVLRDMQQEGKIRHVGVSNFTVAELERARAVVDVVSVQNRYNLAYRNHEPVVDYCTEHGIGFIPWYPLATGALTDHPHLEELAKKYEATPGQIALAWLLARSPAMLPIPGTSSVAHLEENTRGREITLSNDDFEWLSTASLDAV